MEPSSRAFADFLALSFGGGAVAHLSYHELAAYFRLGVWYATNERPLPGALDAVNRVAMATTPDEQRAVAAVLGQFFKPGGIRDAGGDVVRVWRHAAGEHAIAQARAERALTETLRRNGRKGAAKRWQTAAPEPSPQATLPGIEPPPETPAAPVDKSVDNFPELLASAVDNYGPPISPPIGHPMRSRAFKNLLYEKKPAADGYRARDPAENRHQEKPPQPEELRERLLALGVAIAQGDALLGRWIAAGYCIAEFEAAAAKARHYIAPPQRISPSYLSRVLLSERAAAARKPRAPPP